MGMSSCPNLRVSLFPLFLVLVHKRKREACIIMEKPTEPKHIEGGSQELEISPVPTPVQREFDSELEKRNKKLNLRLDIRILPLCCWVYLLNFLDRGNIGNSKVLNQETGDDLLQKTHMTANGYALTVTLFSLAYTIFEVPSNWVMKHYVRPSLWLGILLLCWGALTIGFAGVQNYATVVVLRFLIGVFEAGFFPGGCRLPRCTTGRLTA